MGVCFHSESPSGCTAGRGTTIIHSKYSTTDTYHMKTYSVRYQHSEGVRYLHYVTEWVYVFRGAVHFLYEFGFGYFDDMIGIDTDTS